jgi:predicted negative regulator of RcsB-dependent stress response
VRRPALRAAAVLAAGLFPTVAAPGRALGQDEGALTAAEVAADAGDLERARGYLEQWLASPESTNPGAEVSRALLLRARLASNVDSAEVDYLEAAVRGDERYGALARFRLAQLRLAEGRAREAADDLARLRADFPGSELAGKSWLWSGFALEAAGDPVGACAAWDRASQEAADEETARQAADARSLCTAVSDAVGSGSFTVQLGAFGGADAAEQVRSRAASGGLDVRVTEPDASTPLYRVRVGRFARKDAAARMAVRLRSDGFEAIVVSEGP